jgi:hypothetical protein
MKLRFALIFLIVFSFTGILFSQADSASLKNSSEKIQTKNTRRDLPRENNKISDDSALVKKEPIPLTDSLLRKRHNPRTATLLSIIPGGGQIYNRKWWKVPVVYACLAVSGYFIYDFSVKTSLYQKEYIHRMNGETDLLNPDLATYADENVLALKNYYRRNMEISIGAFAIIYVLNLIDASVDAHLFYFDISDDLSLNIKPSFNNNYRPGTFSSGLALSINF